MFLVTINKPKRLLHFSFIHDVTSGELERGSKDLVALLAELPPQFTMLTDLGRLDTMELACAAVIGRNMELCDAKGVGLIIRVIPDPTKDIGMNILSLFHYKQHPRVVVCEKMEEAAKHLGL